MSESIKVARCNLRTSDYVGGVKCDDVGWIYESTGKLRDPNPSGRLVRFCRYPDDSGASCQFKEIFVLSKNIESNSEVKA